MTKRVTTYDEALGVAVRDEWIDRAIGGRDGVNEDAIRRALPLLYRGMDTPEIVIVDSPMAAQKEASRLINGGKSGALKYTERSWYASLGWSASWGAYIDYCLRAGAIIPGDRGYEDIVTYRDYLRDSGAWYVITLRGWIIVSRPPCEVHRDERGRLHREDGPAIKWRDGWCVYAWHGTRLGPTPERGKTIIEHPETLTAADLREERNSEVLRAIAERMGWGAFLERMGCVVIDRWTDPHTDLSYELLDLAERLGERQPRWLRMQSPVVNDGTQPEYVEPVDPGLRTAQAARAWQFRRSSDQSAKYYRHGDVVLCTGAPDTLYWPSVQECNDKPDVRFQWEA